MAARVWRRKSAASRSSAKCRSTRSIRETSDAGRPIVASAPDGPHAEVFRSIARAVIDRLDAPATRVAPKIVIG